MSAKAAAKWVFTALKKTADSTGLWYKYLWECPGKVLDIISVDPLDTVY